MDYGVYKSARNASWQCLIDCGVSELPVKPTRIASHYGVECIEFAPLLQDGEAGRILQRAEAEYRLYCIQTSLLPESAILSCMS